MMLWMNAPIFWVNFRRLYISELPTDNILCLGDFNADLSRGRLWFNLEEFCQKTEFCIYDICYEFRLL